MPAPAHKLYLEELHLATAYRIKLFEIPQSNEAGHLPQISIDRFQCIDILKGDQDSLRPVYCLALISWA